MVGSGIPWSGQLVPSPARRHVVAWSMAALRGASLAQRVEQHEVVDSPVIAHGGYRHARSAQLGGICLSLVPQDVGLVDAQICRRQPGDLLDAGLIRRRSDIGASSRVGGVGVPEPFHLSTAEVVAGGELLVGRGVHRGVGDRVVQRLLDECDVALFLGHEGQRGRHVAAHRFACNCHAAGIQPFGGAVACDPLGGCVALLDRDRVLGFWRVGVLHERQCRTGADG